MLRDHLPFVLARAARTCGALVLVASVARDARAGGGAATDAYDGIRAGRALDVHGLLDFYAQGNLSAPSSSKLLVLRAFDDHATGLSLGLARVSLAHAPETFGFRLDLGGGDLADAFRDSDPAKTAHPELARALSYVEQAFVTAIVPLGGGLQVDLGKFGTPVGLEENESLTDWNYSRGLLFTQAEPTYHTGARVTYEVTRRLALSGFWLNGWNTNVLDGDGMRSFGAAATWNPDDASEIVVDYVGGLERAPTRLSDPTLTFRHELDAYATYDLTRRVALAATADYGLDEAGAIGARTGTGSPSQWWGVGGYLRCRVLPWLAGAVRGEHFGDRDGFITGTKQRVVAVTATVEAQRHAGPLTVIGRLEYRRDQSDMRVFASGLDHQDTMTLGFLTAF